MKIIISKSIGFCFGVKRAIKLAKNSVKNKKHVYTLGPIIHNPQMVKMLEKMGIEATKDLSCLKDGNTIVIRAHGVEPKFTREIQRRGLKMIDGTCPYVKKSQLLAKKLKDEGYNVVIIGKRDHPEVIGINGHIDDDGIVVQNEEEIKKIPMNSKIGVVIQTTQNISKVRDIISLIFERADELRVFNTICSAVIERQKDAKKISKNVDIMLVIGGRNSENTKKLAEICSKITKTYHVETADEIKKEWFVDVKKVGVTSGTSTPDFIIKEVVEKLNNLSIHIN